MFATILLVRRAEKSEETLEEPAAEDSQSTWWSETLSLQVHRRLEVAFHVLGSGEDQFVAALPLSRLAAVRSRGSRARWPPVQRRAAVSACAPAARPGCVVGQRHLDQIRLALTERHQPDEVADADGLFDEGGQDPRCGHRRIHAPVLAEQPLVARVVDAGDDAVHRELRLGEKGDDERLALSSPVTAIITS